MSSYRKFTFAISSPGEFLVMPCYLVRHFHVLHFYAAWFWWSVIFMFCIWSQLVGKWFCSIEVTARATGYTCRHWDVCYLSARDVSQRYYHDVIIILIATPLSHHVASSPGWLPAVSGIIIIIIIIIIMPPAADADNERLFGIRLRCYNDNPGDIVSSECSSHLMPH